MHSCNLRLEKLWRRNNDWSRDRQQLMILDQSFFQGGAKGVGARADAVYECGIETNYLLGEESNQENTQYTRILNFD